MEMLQVRPQVDAPQHLQTRRGVSQVQVEVLEQAIHAEEGIRMIGVHGLIESMNRSVSDIRTSMDCIKNDAEIMGRVGLADRWGALMDEMDSLIRDMRSLVDEAREEEARQRAREIEEIARKAAEGVENARRMEAATLEAILNGQRAVAPDLKAVGAIGEIGAADPTMKRRTLVFPLNCTDGAERFGTPRLIVLDKGMYMSSGCMTDHDRGVLLVNFTLVGQFAWDAVGARDWTGSWSGSGSSPYGGQVPTPDGDDEDDGEGDLPDEDDTQEGDDEQAEHA